MHWRNNHLLILLRNRSDTKSPFAFSRVAARPLWSQDRVLTMRYELTGLNGRPATLKLSCDSPLLDWAENGFAQQSDLARRFAGGRGFNDAEALGGGFGVDDALMQGDRYFRGVKQHGAASFRVTTDQVINLALGADVDPPRWIVQQQDAAVRQDPFGDSDLLLISRR